MKIIFRLLGAIFLLCIGLSLYLWYNAHTFLTTPPRQAGEDVFVDVPPGSNLSTISRTLAEKGVITDAQKFILLARIKNLDKNLQAGRFRLNNGWTPEQVLHALVNGMPALYRITIPEGLTWWQTAKLLEDNGFIKFGDFADIIQDEQFLRHNGIPFPNAEGFLMPDTYLLPKPDPDKADAAAWKAQAKGVASRLVDNFWRKGTQIWSRDPSGPISRPDPEDLKKWVILASIVEKETGVPSERARVAGVYTNRLDKNMLLQADPTVIYGMGPDFKGRLRRVHLEDAANPYNTYQKGGLPPGPIASFGAACLKAAINPEKHNYLFFVATGIGDTHTFSRNFEEHSAAVKEYRKTQGR